MAGCAKVLKMDLVSKLLWATHLCSIVVADPTLFAPDHSKQQLHISCIFRPSAIFKRKFQRQIGHGAPPQTLTIVIVRYQITSIKIYVAGHAWWSSNMMVVLQIVDMYSGTTLLLHFEWTAGSWVLSTKMCIYPCETEPCSSFCSSSGLFAAHSGIYFVKAANRHHGDDRAQTAALYFQWENFYSSM